MFNCKIHEAVNVSNYQTQTDEFIYLEHSQFNILIGGARGAESVRN